MRKILAILGWHSVDSVLSDFNKAKDRLDKVAERKHRKSIRHEDRAVRHRTLGSLARDERDRANRVAGKIGELVS